MFGCEGALYEAIQKTSFDGIIDYNVNSNGQWMHLRSWKYHKPKKRQN